jgi:hypothetical protein
MPDPFTVAIAGYIAANLPHWQEDIRTILFDKSKEFIGEKGKAWLSEREQQHHLQQVLKKAVRRGLANFQKQQDRDQYRNILIHLFEPGAPNDTLRHEAMTFLTLSDTPNIAELNEMYNRSLRFRNLSQPIPPAEVDAAPYLISFFNALIGELYADSFFKSQISDVIQTRAAMVMPQYIIEANRTLHKIHEAIKDDYTEEQFQQDIASYTAHMERILHNLKIIGVVPKEQNRDPELNGIFVPLRIALIDQKIIEDKQKNSLVTLLEQNPYFVLLGDPGSGKSTAVRHLAWSHAKANLESSESISVLLLPNHPLPLRIELRLLVQDRKQHANYSFLSYATEVLLGREGVKVNVLMFEKLLTQQRMLVLFDGLDEITTLDERQRLVQEIEHFAQLYRGNHILVTSRPVGYELAGCSKELFTHAEVQSFDDDQIRQFLERWYKYVLRLSPLPYEEQQELENLFNTLKENIRLHKLAENPLLLTVITALYRSQRLPEKRVQVYDKCAELLLETWAKLKGTDVRWADMKIGNDDQFACVAHLGYKLHERSQEERKNQFYPYITMDTATDIPERLILREIESFLNSGKLITEIAEQRKEAKLFLDLMRIEAGLIVERGTDENGESIYGFVHRTFQEYFAASDVYERYKQDEDPTIISDFLEEHLHDPHWREVILLLLGKLGRKPVTVRLRQILDGKIKSQRSRYTNILNQDLFFVCDCLLEEIAIENDLGESVISHLSSLVDTSPYIAQSKVALNKLAELVKTKQFASLAWRELTRLAMPENTTSIELKTQIAETLNSIRSFDSKERQEAAQWLLQQARRKDLPIEQIIQAAQALKRSSPADSEERQQAIQIMVEQIRRTDLPFEQIMQITLPLCQVSPIKSEERRQLIQIILEQAQRTDLSLEQIIEATQALKRSSPADSEERQQAIQFFLEQAQRTDLPFEQTMQITAALYEDNRPDSEEKREATQWLLQQAQRTDLSLEQIIQITEVLYNYSPVDSEEERQAIQIMVEQIRRKDLPFEQIIQATAALYEYSHRYLEERQQAIQIILEQIRRKDLPFEQIIQATAALYEYSRPDSEEKREAAQWLLQQARRKDLPIEQIIQATAALYEYSRPDSEVRREVAKLLWQLIQDKKITADQRLNFIKIPIAERTANFQDKFQAVRILSTLLSAEEKEDYLAEKWTVGSSLRGSFVIQPEDIPYLAKLVEQEVLPTRVRDSIYYLLNDSVPQFNKIPFSNNISTS